MRKINRAKWVLKVVAGTCLVGASVGAGASAALAHSKGKTPAPTVFMHGYKCTVVATGKHRRVVGHSGAVVCAPSGNFTLRAAGNGRVVLIAGSGNDTLVASNAPGAQDTLIGGSGDDTIDGGSNGDDVIQAGTGSDTINCGTAGTGGSSGDNTGVDESKRAGTSQVTVVGADSTDDTENSDCSGSTSDSASLELQGLVNTTDGSTTMNITVFDSNDNAQQWLSANDSSCTSSSTTCTVDISLVGAGIVVDGGGTLAAGMDVEVAANASTGTPSTLTAIDVQAQQPQNSGFDD